MASFSKTFPIPGKSSDLIYSAIATDIDRFLAKTPLGQVDVKRDEASFRRKADKGRSEDEKLDG